MQRDRKKENEVEENEVIRRRKKRKLYKVERRAHELFEASLLKSQQKEMSQRIGKLPRINHLQSPPLIFSSLSADFLRELIDLKHHLPQARDEVLVRLDELDFRLILLPHRHFLVSAL
jgi:hypothetical protein